MALTREQILEKYNLDKDLSGLDLQGADLQRAYLQGAYLQGAYLQGAYLQDANLQDAYLQDANLQGADLTDIKNKEILTFTAGKHFAYFTDGILCIGCNSETPAEWLKNYITLAEEYKYSEQQIKDYLSFINICNERETNEIN